MENRMCIPENDTIFFTERSNGLFKLYCYDIIHNNFKEANDSLWPNVPRDVDFTYDSIHYHIENKTLTMLKKKNPIFSTKLEV